MLRISRYLPTVLTLLVSVIVALLAAVLLARLVEARSRNDVSDVLALQGFGWAQVTADGLQVRISGTAPSEVDRFRALSAAGTVVDSARVQDDIQIVAARHEAPRFSIELLRTDSAISLIGLLPEAMDRAAFSQRITAVAAGSEVTDLLESADYPVPRGWNTAVRFALDALERLPRSKISVQPGEVQIKAAAASLDDKRRLEIDLRRRLPDGLQLTLEITAPRPAITPFTLRFLIGADGAARFDACSADTEDARRRILAAAVEAGLAGVADCTIGIGAPSPRWGEAAALAIAALKQVGGGTLTISDSDVSLVALEGIDQERFDTVTGTLGNRLPDAFSLTAVLPKPVAAESADTTPELIATLLDSGELGLRGRVRNDQQMQVIAAFAQGLFGAAKVQNALRVDSAVPDSWSPRVLAALQAMQGLAHGRALVQPAFVEISGVTGNPGLQSDISRILGQKLGGGADFRIDVAYDKKLDPLLGLPTADECVAQINAALAGNKIVFAPGSADIGPEADAVLDRIAALMKNCADFPMEIGGHTDSQGRESMNQELSQARAESVLNALRERQVLTGNLTARGYGESRPIADNGTEEGRETNRRIEFRLLTEGDEPADGDAATEAVGDDAGAE